MTLHRCPVCEGRGQMPARWYLDDDGDDPVACRTCGGTGVILFHDEDVRATITIGGAVPLGWWAAENPQ